MKRIGGVALVAAALVALVACTNSNGESGTQQQSTSTAPTTTAKSASVAQVASVVAEDREDVMSLIRDTKTCVEYDSPECDSSTPLKYSTLQATAGTMKTKLEGVGKAGSPQYKGAVPDEVDGLYTNTVKHLGVLWDALDAFSKSCHKAPGPSTSVTCIAKSQAVRSAERDLEDDLRGWEPYL